MVLSSLMFGCSVKACSKLRSKREIKAQITGFVGGEISKSITCMPLCYIILPTYQCVCIYPWYERKL